MESGSAVCGYRRADLFGRMVAVGERVFIISTGVSAVILIAVLILLWRDGALKRNQP